ncbi:hypothetical protein Bbelb_146440 [Branchiostoma belcheri]|nr:hypothetical protein Bbelb_146440 [Branchiostoma belcheri]
MFLSFAVLFDGDGSVVMAFLVSDPPAKCPPSVPAPSPCDLRNQGEEVLPSKQGYARVNIVKSVSIEYLTNPDEPRADPLTSASRISYESRTAIYDECDRVLTTSSASEKCSRPALVALCNTEPASRAFRHPWPAPTGLETSLRADETTSSGTRTSKQGTPAGAMKTGVTVAWALLALCALATQADARTHRRGRHHRSWRRSRDYIHDIILPWSRWKPWWSDWFSGDREGWWSG